MFGFIRSVRNLARLLRIGLTLVRHDALFPLEILGITPALVAWARLFARRRDARRAGERLTAALQEMGPSFIKLGQVNYRLRQGQSKAFKARIGRPGRTALKRAKRVKVRAVVTNLNGDSGQVTTATKLATVITRGL